MRKLVSKIMLLFLVVLTMFAFIGCNSNESDLDSKEVSKVEKVDLAKTYDGEIKDVDGNLLVPFDVAYSEEFESGNYKYSDEKVLIKVKKSFNEKYTDNKEKFDKDFELCGVKSIYKMYDTDNGTWYTAYLKRNSDPLDTIKYLRSLSYVLVAELDFIYDVESIDDAIVYSESSINNISDESDISWANGKVHKNKLLNEQDYLKYSELQKTWKYLEDNGIEPGGLSSTVVAVIDTGVDYTHPDLKDNMWVNINEIPGNRIDDDNNGYIDDIYGANVIANNGNADNYNTGNPMDDHGHGTHVAGIIGASNNEEGIVGIAYNARIMAVKAGQASGYFNQSDIAEAILYAYSMGAEVINMSFGGSACSIAVQEALQTAYTSAVLVAAAGNDTAANEYLKEWIGNVIPNYPAALSYVTGVMSVGRQGMESSFTNFDSYGYNSVEYEVYAIGEDIMSTLPNGKYGKLSGTSMAAPVVSGTAAILRSYFKDRDMYPSKFIMAQISATSEQTAICIHDIGHNMPMILDIYDALTKLPKPDVNLYDRHIFDTEGLSDANNGDGVIDAGETLDIGVILKNRWGMSKDTIVTITDKNDLGGDDPYVEIINGSANFEGVGTYSTKDTLVTNDDGKIIDIDNPLTVKISKNCPNDYTIKLNVKIEYKNGLDDKDNTQYTTSGTIEFGVRNGVVLTGQITEDMTLTSDNYYIIPSMLYINEGVTVTVEEGTNIQFWASDAEDQYAEEGIASITVAGNLIVNGTYENPVNMFPSEFMDRYAVKLIEYENGHIYLNYTNVKNPYVNISEANYCNFSNVYSGEIYNKGLNEGEVYKYSNPSAANIVLANKCIFKDMLVGYIYNENFSLSFSGMYNESTFMNVSIENTFVSYSVTSFNSCVFQNSNIDLKVNPLSSINLQGIFTYDNHSYVLYELPYASNGIRATTDILQMFFNSIGGDLACFETNEEFYQCRYNYENRYFYRLMNKLLIGIKDNKQWINGETIGDFVEFGDELYKYYTCESKYENEKWELIVNNYLPEYALYEIPETYDEDGNLIVWSNELLNEAFKNFVENRMDSSIYTNNAFLNNYNDSSMNSWTKFHSAEIDDYSDHYIFDKIYLGNNYFGTTDIDLINKMITDYDDYMTLWDINVDNYLTEAPSNTFPFVVDAYLLNSNGERAKTVSNEQVTCVVEFNRDMDVTVPLRVRFGSSEPYAEYEIKGEYVTPRRWEGTYTLKTTIENGNQIINISNGKASDDNLDLYDVPGRFMFEIDTTLAQAMIMQGEATETGINLTWMQDDFDTLLGYNVYRSTEEDGLYTRLNNYVLSYDENTFFDDTVEPGVKYYYNFTVVKTDLTESTPSGKIVIRSMDTMAPNVYHTPINEAYTNNNLLVNATVVDNLIIKGVKLYYKVSNTDEWKSVEMNKVNNKYMGIIQSDYITLSGIEYYIVAYDGISYTYNGSKENPYKVTVKEELSKDAYGDVDGDGIITVKDAQILLMAINDLLNLNSDEFARADIDRNGKLEAFEALRILDYISGKVNYIV